MLCCQHSELLERHNSHGYSLVQPGTSRAVKLERVSSLALICCAIDFGYKLLRSFIHLLLVRFVAIDKPLPFLISQVCWYRPVRGQTTMSNLKDCVFHTNKPSDVHIADVVHPSESSVHIDTVPLVSPLGLGIWLPSRERNLIPGDPLPVTLSVFIVETYTEETSERSMKKELDPNQKKVSFKTATRAGFP